MIGLRRWRRRRLLSRPLPDAWRDILERRAPYCRVLPPDLRQDLAGLVQVFVDEKLFEGCAGLEVTDEIRLTIAAHACVLLLGGPSDMFPRLRTVLVYPGAYVAPRSKHRPGGVVDQSLEARLGESWSFGNVVISWEDAVRDAVDIERGRNVVFHEFAHQLDAESGPDAEGAPVLPSGARYSEWARVFKREYNFLRDCAERGIRTLLDSYGAESPAEFFAVATECFFLKPRELEARHPELYRQLRIYYRQDPARYSVGPRP